MLGGWHTFRVREIAAQAGLSEATVDRVLHQRVGVQASTVDEVHQAIADLGRQRSQLRLAGRTFMVARPLRANAHLHPAGWVQMRIRTLSAASPPLSGSCRFSRGRRGRSGPSR